MTRRDTTAQSLHDPFWKDLVCSFQEPKSTTGRHREQLVASGVDAGGSSRDGEDPALSSDVNDVMDKSEKDIGSLTPDIYD